MKSICRARATCKKCGSSRASSTSTPRCGTTCATRCSRAMNVHAKPPNRLVVLGAQIALTVAFLAAWQWGAHTGHIDTFFFASPFQIGASIAKWWSHNYVLNDVAVTMEETLLGLAIGGSARLVLSVLLASNRWLG